MLKFPWLAFLAAMGEMICTAPASAEPVSVTQQLRPGGDRITVVAHRGCHNAVPAQGIPDAPENSLAALENCVRLGVDMLEIDVRRSADGALVLIHDPTVDRTTDGTGRVADMTLAQLRALRLRQNLGGAEAPITDERIVTLDEMLMAARGRVLLNLDIKDAVHTEAIEAVIRAGMADQVIVKSIAGRLTRPLAAMAPYDRVAFMPILDDPIDPAAVAVRQMDGAQPIAFELPTVTPDQLVAVAEASRGRGIPLWVNTLWGGFVTGWGGDANALRDPDAVWGRLYRAGVRIFQTDEPTALLAYRARVAGQER